MSTPAALAALQVLVRHDVRFIVVGGVAAVLHGVPLYTGDVDVLYALDEANVDRMFAAVEELESRFRSRPDLQPARSHLASRGHKLLQTKHGSVDVLGFIGQDRSYEDLLPGTVKLQVAGLTLTVLDLTTLIAVKEELGHEKDLAALPLLKAALRERE